MATGASSWGRLLSSATTSPWWWPGARFTRKVKVETRRNFIVSFKLVDFCPSWSLSLRKGKVTLVSVCSILFMSVLDKGRPPKKNVCFFISLINGRWPPPLVFIKLCCAFSEKNVKKCENVRHDKKMRKFVRKMSIHTIKCWKFCNNSDFKGGF